VTKEQEKKLVKELRARAKRIIFMGNGDHSMAQCYELHRELERAFSILGGIQQPGGSEEEVEEGEFDVEHTAKKIYTALTGKRIIKSK